MLSILRNNSPYTAIILFIITLALSLQSLLHPVLPQAGDSQLLYGWILSLLNLLLGKSAFAYSLLTVLMVYLQAIYLNAVAARHRLYNRITYLPAYAYIILSAAHPSLSQFNPNLLVNWLILMLVNELLQLQQSHKPNRNLFNIGLLLMTAALMQFASVLLFFFLFPALFILRPFNMREWVITISGIVMPLYTMVVLLFLTDKLPLLRLWADVGISLPRQMHPAVYYLGVFAFIIILFVGSLFNMQVQLPKSTIYIRRCWTALSLLFVCSLLASVFTDPGIKAAWMMSIPALSLIMAYVFYNEKSKMMSRLGFYSSVAFVVFCQIFLPI